MKRLLVIGIGAGNPEYITIQAINALNAADVFFIVDKGQEKADLTRLRKEICERYIKDRDYRFVEMADPPRDRSAAAYATAVDSWRHRRREIFETAIGTELSDGACGAFLVWGDPSLYDGTIQVLRQILADRPGLFDYEVIPGISSVQALAARHKIALNRTGESIHITTGRKLAEGFPDGADTVIIMLDGDAAFRTLKEQDVEVFWGAYLGTADEVLVAGPLRDTMDEIERIRKAQKEAHGWIMDTYLLRRPRSG